MSVGIQTVTYPTNYSLTYIEKKLVTDTLARDPVLNDIMGVEIQDTSTVQWDQEDENYGEMAARAYGEPYKSVIIPGSASHVMSPMSFGEYYPLSEQKLTEKRQYGTVNAPIYLSSEVYKAQDFLRYRRFVRMCRMGWTLLLTGNYRAFNDTGALVGELSYTPRQFTSTVAYTDYVNSTPIADLRSIALLARGYSLDLGVGAKIYLNRVTMNAIQQNMNPNDLGGRRVGGANTINNVGQINNYMAQDDLPTYVVYDGGYRLAPGGSGPTGWVPFIPNGYMVAVGARPNGEKLAKWIMTRNANNPNFEPGPFATVYDSAQHGARPPREIQVYSGFNGGIAVYYPFGYVIMKVF